MGNLASYEKLIIAVNLGKVGERIHDYANGLDNSTVGFVHDIQEAKSIGNGMTFRRDLVGLDDIILGLSPLADSVSTRLRKSGLKCTTVQVVILDPQFKTISRQKKLEKPTYLYKDIRDKAIEIIRSSWNQRAPIRMLTITAMNLVTGNETEQLSFFGEEIIRNTLKLKKSRRRSTLFAADLVRDQSPLE